MRPDAAGDLDWMCYRHRALMNTFRLQYKKGDPLLGESWGERFIKIARSECRNGLCEPRDQGTEILPPKKV